MVIAFMVVDEDVIEREIIGDLLRRAMPGAQILEAHGADEALGTIEDRRLVPSLIFTDMTMSGGGGLELLAGLRRFRWLERTPVAVVTYRASDREVLNAFRLGACAVLTKPTRLYDVRAVVREFAQPAKLMSVGRVQTEQEFERQRSAA